MLSTHVGLEALIVVESFVRADRANERKFALVHSRERRLERALVGGQFTRNLYSLFNRVCWSEFRRTESLPAMPGERAFQRESSRTFTTSERSLLFVPFEVRSEATFVATSLRAVRTLEGGTRFLALRWSTFAAFRLLARLNRSASSRLRIGVGLRFAAGCELRRKHVRQLVGQEQLKLPISKAGQNAAIHRVRARRLLAVRLLVRILNEAARRVFKLRSA